MCRKTRNATSDSCDKKRVFRMPGCELYKLIHKRLNGLYPTLHRGDAITLPLQSHTLSPYRAKVLISKKRRTAAMAAGEVAAKHENFMSAQPRDPIRCKFSVVHILYLVI